MSLKKYRLTSMKEPTDKELSGLMREVIKDARKEALATKKKLAQEITKEIKKVQARFKTKK